MKNLISVKGLSKHYGSSVAVDSVDFTIGAGRIVGLVGPNGAGKSTTLKAILGLCSYKGQLDVLGMKPKHDREKLMQKVSYISDVAALPGWIRVDQLLRFMRDTHPAFEQSRTMGFLEETDIGSRQKVGTLSKGMKTQLHLALAMGVDAQLLILDEPTLGLDILYRKKFYQRLLGEYFDNNKTILITTHQIEEVESILTDILFINQGRIIVDLPVADIGKHYSQVIVATDKLEQAAALQPLLRVKQLKDSVMTFKNVDRQQLQEIGEVSTPHLADLFVACVEGDKNA